MAFTGNQSSQETRGLGTRRQPSFVTGSEQPRRPPALRLAGLHRPRFRVPPRRAWSVSLYPVEGLTVRARFLAAELLLAAQPCRASPDPHGTQGGSFRASRRVAGRKCIAAPLLYSTVDSQCTLPPGRSFCSSEFATGSQDREGGGSGHLWELGNMHGISWTRGGCSKASRI